MDQENRYYGIILRRFFNHFKNITYYSVPISRYLYYHFMGDYIKNHWPLNRAQGTLPYFQTEISQFHASEMFSWSEEPYPFDAHPDGIIVMRGGFVDIAVKHLPPEKYFLICHNQAEVDLIKANLPDQNPRSIEAFFRDNPQAVQALNQQVAEVIAAQKDDPLFGDPALLQWFQRYMDWTVRMIDAVHALFEQMNIGAVLTISSINGMESALNLVAKANRIPSFTAQHGLISDHEFFGHVPVLATKKLVWGQAVLDWYKKFGVPESRVAIVGSPRYEIIFNRKWSNKTELCQMLGVEPTRKIIVFATQRLYLSEACVPMLLEGLAPFPKVFLVLLLHPSESQNIEKYQHLIQGHANCKVVRFGHISLYDALSGADFFLTCYSSAALEAMLFKLPVITAEPAPLEFSYGELGVSLKVTNAAEFSRVLDQLLTDEAFRSNAIERYQKYLQAQCLPDGLASQRFFAEIQMATQNGGVA